MRSFGALVLCLIAQLCANVLAAAPISQSLSLFQPSNVNSSNPYNLTLPTSYNALPSDPSIYTVPQSTQQILFSRYSRTLPQKDVLSCLLQAANMVIKELNKENFGPIDTEDIQTSSGIAHLIFYPASKMTWGMFGTTIRGLTDFVSDWEYIDFDFEVKEIGYPGIMGSGMLAYI